MIRLSHPERDPYLPELQQAISRVALTGRYILGPETEALEASYASLTGAAHAIAVSSCTDALYIAYRWLNWASISVPALTFVATAESAVRAGLRTNFYDIGGRGGATVHLFGLHPGYTGAIADKAQCFPERFESSLAECYSFFPAKPLGSFGDGGMIVTNTEGFAQYARAMRNHGSFDRVTHDHVGSNMRMSEIQAAVINVKLKHLDYYKNRKTDWFRRRFPVVGDTYANVVSEFAPSGFETKRYYSKVVPHHPAYGQRGSWPISEWFAERLWAVPCGPELTDPELDEIARNLECLIYT